uniref:Uncharacterized protein n=1 Tax=Lotharella globosa TaxID=91324 RepID=A0A7S3Z996_9EUKA
MPPKRKVTRQGSLNFTVVKRRGSPPRLEKDIGIPTNKFEKDKKIDDIVKKPIVVKVKPEPKAKQKPKVSKKHREGNSPNDSNFPESPFTHYDSNERLHELLGVISCAVPCIPSVLVSLIVRHLGANHSAIY